MRLIAAALMLLLALPTSDAATAAEDEPLLNRDHPLANRIWLPAEGTFIQQDELARRLAAADFVLLGEKHDNPEHHRLEAWALQAVLAAGKAPVVAFEMITPDQQAALDGYHGDAAGLGAALDWGKSGWPDYALYQPIFAEAMAAGRPIRAANLGRDSLRALARGEGVAPERMLFYRLDKPLRDDLRESLAQEIGEAHCGQLPEKAVAGMINVQRARDAAMAHAVSDDAPGGGVLIAGWGHVRADRGLPVHLASLAPGRSLFALGFTEVEPENLQPSDYLQVTGTDRPLFDAVWFTPGVAPIDGCAEMTKAMEKKKISP